MRIGPHAISHDCPQIVPRQLYDDRRYCADVTTSVLELDLPSISDTADREAARAFLSEQRSASC